MIHHDSARCHEILQQLNAYIDGELDAGLCTLLETHLTSCSNCTIVYNTLKKTIELCQQDGQKTTLPPDVRKRLLANLNLDEDASQDG